MAEWMQVHVSVPMRRVGSLYELVGRWWHEEASGIADRVDEGPSPMAAPADLLHQRDDAWRIGSVGQRLHDARNLYRGLSDGARAILDYLMDRPGERIDADDLAGAVGAESARGVAGRLASFGRRKNLGGNRAYPFLWAEDKNGTTRYWMEPDVAELFCKARQTLAGGEAARRDSL